MQINLTAIAGTVSAIFLVVGCLYAAWRTVRKQTDEKEQDRALAAMKTYSEVMEKERDNARIERDLNAAARDHALEQVETLRGIADNTPRLDKIIELLETQNTALRKIEERGRADT